MKLTRAESAGRQRPQKVLTQARLADKASSEYERTRFGYNRGAFQRRSYRSERVTLARRIERSLCDTVQWRQRMTGDKLVAPRVKMRIGEVKKVTVSQIALDLAAPAMAYRAARRTEEAIKRVGRRSYFNSPAMQELIRASASIYRSHLGRKARAGDPRYKRNFRSLMVAVLFAVDQRRASRSKRALTDGISRSLNGNVARPRKHSASTA